MNQPVWCEKHPGPAHQLVTECMWPHFADYPGTVISSVPSMTAVETLDPREAVWL